METRAGKAHDRPPAIHCYRSSNAGAADGDPCCGEERPAPLPRRMATKTLIVLLLLDTYKISNRWYGVRLTNCLKCTHACLPSQCESDFLFNRFPGSASQRVTMAITLVQNTSEYVLIEVLMLETQNNILPLAENSNPHISRLKFLTYMTS